ncbi:MAG: hypothetical protein JNJ41_02285 [Bacteroidia bacterium]|nr:hypothetical protein [Bacteroidia bacterium]
MKKINRPVISGGNRMLLTLVIVLHAALQYAFSIYIGFGILEAPIGAKMEKTISLSLIFLMPLLYLLLVFIKQKKFKTDNYVICVSYLVLLVFIALALKEPYRLVSESVWLGMPNKIYIINPHLVYFSNYFLSVLSCLVIVWNFNTRVLKYILALLPLLFFGLILIYVNRKLPAIYIG